MLIGFFVILPLRFFGVDANKGGDALAQEMDKKLKVEGDPQKKAIVIIEIFIFF